MDWDVWEKQFQPIKNLIPGADMEDLHTPGDRFETYGLEIRAVHFCLAFFPLHVWTVADADSGDELFLCNGYHYVNRMYYYITKNPALPNVDYQVSDV